MSDSELDAIRPEDDFINGLARALGKLDVDLASLRIRELKSLAASCLLCAPTKLRCQPTRQQ